MEFVGIALRAVISYSYALLALRLAGKRSLQSMSPADFLISLVVGDLFDDIFWGTVPVAHGLMALGVLVSFHVLFEILDHRFEWFSKIVIGSAPTLVVRNASFHREGMKRERTGEDEVRSALRELGEENLVEVRQANWEGNGQLSALKKEQYKPAQKKDLPDLKEVIE